MLRIKHKSLFLCVLLCATTCVQSVTWYENATNRVSAFFHWAYTNITTSNISPKKVALLSIIVPLGLYGSHQLWKSRAAFMPSSTAPEQRGSEPTEQEKKRQFKCGKYIAESAREIQKTHSASASTEPIAAGQPEEKAKN